MSRDLTKYVRPKDKNPEVEKVMEQMGCSEPVARNMLKMRKFGMGPLGAQPTDNEGGILWRLASPPRLGSTGSGMAADRKRKLQEREDQVREEEKKEKDSFFEQAERPKERKKMDVGKLVGISRLGPVMSRQEVVDPLDVRAVTLDKVQLAREEAERRQKEVVEAARKAAEDRRLAMEKAEAEERRRKKRKPKKKRRGEADEAFEGDSGDDEEGGEETKKGSDDEGKDPKAAGAGGASSSSSLMTEAEVLARMNKTRNPEKKAERGSWRTAARVAKELEEWEQVKAHDAEYNRAPRFALCFSAETGRKRGY